MTDRNYAFVRTEDAPTLAPPASQVGIWGWLWRNMFASMANFSSPGAAVQSSFMILLTIGVGWFGLVQIITLLDFAVFSAVWSSPEGMEKRAACTTTLQGGALPEDWYGACYPYISAFWQGLIYGDYPDEALWRVNAVFLIGSLGIGWLVAEAIPRRRIVGVVLLIGGVAYGYLVHALYGEPLGVRVGAQITVGLGVIFMLAPEDPPRKVVGALMLFVFPIAAFILLTGGDLRVDPDFWTFWGVVAAVLIGFGVASGRGLMGSLGSAFGGVALTIGLVVVAMLVAVFLATRDYGMETAETEVWGGLLVTLVVAVAGIVFSLPLGILLALGRRSSLPAIRILSIVFIEFWRGVPLITVLFMSSVMLPFFLPPGVEFNKLLRALIGVMFFAAAYQAEVVRGGLQAIPKGQFEGAQAVGLPFWSVMRLIVLPQALTLVIPGIVNTFIGLFKDTTLVLIISLFDLLGKVQQTLSSAEWATPVQAPTGYLTAAAIFWIFCFGMSRYSMFMERKLRRGHSR